MCLEQGQCIYIFLVSHSLLLFIFLFRFHSFFYQHNVPEHSLGVGTEKCTECVCALLPTLLKSMDLILAF